MINTPPPGERLTPRARAYLWFSAAQHAAASLALLAVPDSFTAQSFIGIKGALPGLAGARALLAWGLIFALVALLCAYAALVARENPARWALFASIISTLAWLGGFIAAFQAGATLSPIGVILCAAIVAKDMTMIRDPLRNPFEPIVRRFSPRYKDKAVKVMVR